MQGSTASQIRPATLDAPDLLGALRQRHAQAQEECAPYLAVVLEQDSMLLWLARAAVQAREAAGRKQVHIAASADRDQSSIYRFEQAAKGKSGWPRDADRIVAAYADDLDIDPIALWAQALQMWQKDREENMGDRIIEIAEGVAHEGHEPAADGPTGKARRGRGRRAGASG